MVGRQTRRGRYKKYDHSINEFGLSKQYCCTNKYFKTVLISYYILSRNVILREALYESQKPKFFEKMLDEYLQFNAGFDINIEQENEEVSSFMPRISSPSKSRQYLSAIRLSQQQRFTEDNSKNVSKFEEIVKKDDEVDPSDL